MMAVLVAAKIIYSNTVFIIVLFVLGINYVMITVVARHFVIAVSPITALHTGFSCSADTVARAEALGEVIRDVHEQQNKLDKKNASPAYLLHRLSNKLRLGKIR